MSDTSNLSQQIFYARRLAELKEREEGLRAEYFRTLRGLHLLDGEERANRHRKLDTITGERTTILREIASIQLAVDRFGKRTVIKGEKKKYYHQPQRGTHTADPDNPAG